MKEANDNKAEDESVNLGMNFVIVKNWKKNIDQLRTYPNVETLSQDMGFDLPTLVATLIREFPKSLRFETVINHTEERIEEVATETITVNNKPLDRLLVMAYPAAANPNLTEMTKFKYGGEVILVTEGEAEITYAAETTDGFIPNSSLKSEKVVAGDLIISTDTPNNWTKIFGENFTFIYFVGNPNGPQQYSEIPKEKIPIK